MSSVREFAYDLLQSDSSITDEVGTRVYYGTAPQELTLPFVVVTHTMNGDSFTKDRTSSVDEFNVVLSIYHNTVADAESIGSLIYAVFQGYSGTINGNTVQGIRLEDEEGADDVEIYPVWVQDYQIRLER